MDAARARELGLVRVRADEARDLRAARARVALRALARGVLARRRRRRAVAVRVVVVVVAGAAAAAEKTTKKRLVYV